MEAERVTGQTRYEDLPLFAAAKPRPVPAPEPKNPKARPLVEAGDEARAIWEVLRRDCRGIERAVPAPVIGLRAGLWVDASADVRGRNVRVVIAQHLDDFSEVVVATPKGFFVAECPEDLEAAHQVLRSRMIEMYQRELSVIRCGLAKGWRHLGKGRWVR
jgi:hypothetical protein